MKKGFLSAIFPDLSFREVMQFAAEQKMDCVEIACWPKSEAERRYAGITHIDTDHLTDEKVKEIKDIMKETGVTISALGYYPNPMDPDEKKAAAAMDHIRSCILAAERLGVGEVNTFIGKDKNKSVEENFQHFLKVWPPVIEFAEKHGIKIGIENCPMYFTDDEFPGGNNLASTPAIWRRMFEAIPNKNFGLNYDPSHLIWQQIDYVKPLYEFKDRIFHVHLKDLKINWDVLRDEGIYTEPLRYQTPKIPGLGDIDFSSFFCALYNIGFDGCAVIEIEDRAFEPGLETRKDAIRISQRYLSQFMA